MDPCIPKCGIATHSDAETTAALAAPVEASNAQARVSSGVIGVPASPGSAAGVKPIVLSDWEPFSSPSPPIDQGLLAIQSSSAPAPPPPLIGNPVAFHLGLIVGALATLAMLIAGVRHVFGARGRRALALADAAGASDGSWLLVRYEWGGEEGAPGRMPIIGMSSTGELVAALVEFGAEAVDAAISAHAIDVKYTDDLGVERRLGAKTQFETIRRARLVTVRKRAFSESEPVKQRLLQGAARPEKKRPESGAPSRACRRGHGGSTHSRKAKGCGKAPASIAPEGDSSEEEFVPEGACSDGSSDDAASRVVQEQV